MKRLLASLIISLAPTTTWDAKKGERLGKMIDRVGTEPFKAALA